MDGVHLGRTAPRGRGSSEHHVDEVCLGRRVPRRQSSSQEKSTMWMRFIWGGEHHKDQVRLERRGRKADLADS